MTGPLFVDPEELERRGAPFHDRARQFQQLRSYLVGILARYPNAFGDDDLGSRFRETFLGGVRGIDARIHAVALNLEYTGDGLVTNGGDFRSAELDARRSAGSLDPAFRGTAPGQASPRTGRH